MRQRLVWLTLIALAALPAAADAQYFGQNKVQYRRFDWQIVRTEHFDVHYYGDMRPAALDAARMAERAYARLSRILQHEFIERKPLILYASQSDFVQTNTTGGDVGEGTGGFTDFYRHRMVLPFTGSYADFEHVLQHEMVHGFQYDIYARGRAGAGFQTLAQVNPPLWFMEGMAEYLSLGPLAPHTAMWMRDAALNGEMPTIEQLTYDTRFFPYRFGHALWAYVAQKWGDESVGAILHATLSGGIERAFQRTLGLTLEQLGDEWIEAVQNSYLPLVADQQRPRSFARPSLVARKTKGRYNLAPQISPDGRQVIFLSERSILSVDLYIADTEGRNITRLLSSGFDPDFETFRFINSAGAWSQDGREFVLTSKSGGEDILIFVDVRRRRVSSRLRLGFEGILNPSYSPDGQQIVFTGLRGGWSDLYIVNRDGNGLRRLTNDAYAELMPQWSPDGRAIAFATDRGPDTDFSVLRFGTMKIALYWLAGDSISILPRMDEGKNTNPVWSPDGSAIAFLSDRNGASNVFLYDLVARDVYQLSRAYTGITGITDLSPAISWARQADRVAITYYENGSYNVYIAESPRSLQREPYRTDSAAVLLLANASAQPLRTPPSGYARGVGAGRPAAGPAGAAGAVVAAPPTAAALPADQPGGVPTQPPSPSDVAQSIYRGAGGFRPSDGGPAGAGRPGAPVRSDSAGGAAPLSVAALLDSAELALPDTAEFGLARYKAQYSADIVSRPTIGYARDNFGRGFFGGAAVQFTDLLGDHSIVLSGAVNGRIQEAQLYGAYTNMTRRINWAVGAAQDVWYYYNGSGYVQLPTATLYVQSLDRWAARQIFGQAYYPLNRFKRLEFRNYFVNLANDRVDRITVYDIAGYPVSGFDSTIAGTSKTYVMPGLGLVFDNTLFGWTSILTGKRYRFDLAQALGGYEYTQVTADYRRYDMLAFPFTFATRITMQGRFGRDEELFPIFVGTPDRVRGYTYNSFLDNECSPQVNVLGSCNELDQLVGSRMAVASAEFRFPLVRQVALGFLPVGLPPIEGAFFFDAGIAWARGATLVWNRDPGDPVEYRAPVMSWGVSMRVNLLGFAILAIDYAMPLDRPGYDGGLWIFSLYPPF